MNLPGRYNRMLWFSWVFMTYLMETMASAHLLYATGGSREYNTQRAMTSLTLLVYLFGLTALTVRPTRKLVNFWKNY